MNRFDDVSIYAFIPTDTLYEMLEALLEDIDDKIFNKVVCTLKESTKIKAEQLRNSGKICAYLSELYRRNLLVPTVKWYELDPYRCNKCKKIMDPEDSLYTFSNKPERSGYIRCYECIKVEETFKIYNSEECAKIHKNDSVNKLWDVLFTIKEEFQKDYSTTKKIKNFMMDGIRDALTLELKKKIESLDETTRTVLQEYLPHDNDYYMMEIPEQVNLLNYLYLTQINECVI